MVLALPGRTGRPRVGITVSSRVGNAVVRNQIKRWVREAFRAVASELPPVELVVIARAGAGRVGWAGAMAALEGARRRLIEGLS